jgi:hypothetical protein
MTKRQFSRPPMLSSTARPSGRVAPGELAPEVQHFKATYVHERRFLERFRNGETDRPYQPSTQLEGSSRYDTPEEPEKVNQWVKVYQNLGKAQQLTTPAQYVRVVFKILRGSSLAIPTLIQLQTANLVEMVTKFLQNQGLELRQQFVTESQRARSSIVINQKGVGHSLSLSVYYAIVDSRLELSPLFKYCLAVTTSEHVRQSGMKDLHCEKLDRLAKRYEFMAAMDYTLFPDLYDAVWGKAIPTGFRVAANSMLANALEQ